MESICWGTTGRLTMSQESITDLEEFGKATKLACTTADISLGFMTVDYFSHAIMIEVKMLQVFTTGTSDALQTYTVTCSHVRSSKS